MKTNFQLLISVLLLFHSAGVVCAIGGRHDVPGKKYLELGNNSGQYKAGKDYPDFSSVCVLGNFSNDDDWHGAGVLIAPQWVLTAAHVSVLADNARQFERRLKVRFGVAASEKRQEYKVVQIYTPLPIEDGAYDPLVKRNAAFPPIVRMRADLSDIALLKLSQPVKGITPAQPFLKKPVVGSKIFIAGYGPYTTGDNTDESRWLEDGKKRAAENALDRDGVLPGGGLIAFDFDNGDSIRNSLMRNRFLDYELSSMLGLGRSDAKPMPLEGSGYPGDSGGPVFANEDGVWKVLGVCGFGTEYPLVGEKGYIQYGDVVCSTRVPSHYAWIRRTMSGGLKDKE